ncbi:MAG: methyltransferase domain-containing protein [Alphaproteobacteria bacterium]|nr:methyltransferase domain-containing protein [Alphaproteobacteria bacterium]
MNTIGPQASQDTLQAPFDVAVIIPTVLRDTLMRAVRSVFTQEWPGRVQILIGVDVAQGDRDMLRQLGAECPDRMALTIFDPGYSTAQVHGGIYHNAFSGSLRTVLSYAANSRRLAYLDDDNWWAPHHLSDLLLAIDGFDWAFSHRWYVDAGTQEPFCVDDFESVGPGRGIYAEKLGGFVDANCLMIDKTKCHWALPNWSIPMLPDGSGEDRNVFSALVKQHAVAWTRRPSVYYVINPDSGVQPIREKIFAERGYTLTKPQRAKSATFTHQNERINEYLLSNLTRKLHLGAGTNILPGWLNTDIAPHSRDVLALDLTRPLPFEDETFDYVASEHFIEHMNLSDGIRLLGECFRIMKPGARLRLATPDITRLLALYAAEPTELQKRYVDWVTKTFIGGASGYNPTLILNNMFYNWGHRFIYDQNLLAAILSKIGFADLAVNAVGESPDPNLANIEKHGHIVGAPDMNAYETMAMKGRKP